jgi:hypothetical protein
MSLTGGPQRNFAIMAVSVENSYCGDNKAQPIKEINQGTDETTQREALCIVLLT